MSDIIGQFLGKYKILEEIGRGGFGTVYRANDPTLDRIVALKVLHPQLMRDPGFLERFSREAKGTARLKHPNIVPVHEVNEADGRQFIVMEYLPGRSLDKLIAEQGQLAPERALHILAQVAAALDYAHSKGLTHRDVKPSNIIVGPDEASADPDHATLTDFGLVRATDQSIMTSIGQALGTPTYMSPEQLDVDRQADVGAASDIYAFAIVAYELLAGRPPFVGPTPALMAAHLTKAPPAITQFKADLPPDVWKALAPALAKNVVERPKIALALVADLRVALMPAPQQVIPVNEDLRPIAPPSSLVKEADERWETDNAVITPPALATAAKQIPESRQASKANEQGAAGAQSKALPPTRTGLDRRIFPILAGLIGIAILTSAIALNSALRPQPVSTPQVIEKVIRETVVVEKPVERVIEKPVEKIVQVTVVLPSATPQPPTATVLPTSTSTHTLTPAATPTPRPDAVVNTDALNVRSGPGESYPIVGKLTQDTALHVVGKEPGGQWLKVEATNGVSGWVFTTLLQVNIPLPNIQTLTVPPTPTLTTEQIGKLVDVRADKDWQDSGVDVQSGQVVRITYVSGRWSPWSGSLMDGNGCLGLVAICSQDPNWPDNVYSFIHAGLIGRIAGETPFAIGNDITLNAPSSGRIYLRINDKRIEDNSGSITVRVAVNTSFR